MNNAIKAEFGAQLSQIPMLQKQLAEISSTPARLDSLIERMERSNSTLASQVNATMTKTTRELMSVSSSGETSPYSVPQMMPKWMKWTILVSVIFIALACVSNTVYNICFDSPKNKVVYSSKKGSL